MIFERQNIKFSKIIFNMLIVNKMKISFWGNIFQNEISYVMHIYVMEIFSII